MLEKNNEEILIAELIRNINDLLVGKIPKQVELDEKSNPLLNELRDCINQLVVFIKEIKECIIPLSQGNLKHIQISSDNYLASPFKALHSSLLHLTWQAAEVAKGDYTQRVDFMGDFSNAFNSMVVSLETNENLLKNKIAELKDAIDHISTLEGLLPVCAFCKKIRLEGTDPDTQKNWVNVEKYIEDRTKAHFSHGICPECLNKYYPE
ncbi:MAG: hypothetical protein R3F48_13495 [Candidatus Zixiibacteriota bacterium]